MTIFDMWVHCKNHKVNQPLEYIEHLCNMNVIIALLTIVLIPAVEQKKCTDNLHHTPQQQQHKITAEGSRSCDAVISA